MKRSMKSWIFLAALILSGGEANATLISVSGPASLRGALASIIAAPADVNNAGASNLAQQGFDEVQNYILGADLNVDGGTIAAGTTISSHMIFLNNSEADAKTLNEHEGVQWVFDGTILGVMSDYLGSLEIASSSFLGAPGTAYPVATFNARGIEDDDSYSFALDTLTFNSRIRQPGDWIRVITTSTDTSVPEPATLALLSGAAALCGIARRRKRSAS